MSWKKDQVARHFEELRQAGLAAVRLAPRCPKHGQPLAGIIPGPPVEGLPCPECWGRFEFERFVPESNPGLHAYHKPGTTYTIPRMETERWLAGPVKIQIESRGWADETVHTQTGIAWERT